MIHMLKESLRRKKKRQLIKSGPGIFDWDWNQIHYNRIALINYVVAKFPNECRYLEIGCFKNDLFSSVPVTDKVGIDPEQGGNMRCTSDEFFAQNQKTFDVIFIDGLHTYEQTRKDVINATKHLSKNGWIALHDLLPRNAAEAHLPRVSSSWTGDVWKLGFELANTKGVDFKIIKIDCGVGILRLTGEPVIFSNQHQSQLQSKAFDYYYERFSQLPTVSWREALAWVDLTERTLEVES